jgi:hypothetical protein
MFYILQNYSANYRSKAIALKRSGSSAMDFMIACPRGGCPLAILFISSLRLLCYDISLPCFYISLPCYDISLPCFYISKSFFNFSLSYFYSLTFCSFFNSTIFYASLSYINFRLAWSYVALPPSNVFKSYLSYRIFSNSLFSVFR